MNPPPLLNQANAQKSFAHQAAKASIAAPIIGIVVNFAWLSSQHGEPLNRSASMIVGWVATMLILVGFVFAVIALCAISRHGKEGLLGRGLAGLVLNGVLLAAMTTMALAGIERAQRKVVQQDLNSASRDLRSSLGNNYDPKLGITNDLSSQLGEFHSKIDAAAKSASGEDAILMQAMGAFTATMQAKTKEYKTVVDELIKTDVTNLGTLKERNQIEERRQLVRRFLATNKEFKELLASQDQVIKSELESRKLPSAKIEQLLTGFRRAQAPMFPKVAAIRAADDRRGQALLKILDIGEAQWGKWHYDDQTKRTLFDDNQAADEFNKQIEEVKQSGEEQVRLQGEIIKRQQSRSGGEK